MRLDVLAPVAGTLVAVEDVPDPVFAGKFVGPGVAVEPDAHARGPVTALAPICGTVVKIHPHAFVIVDHEGRAVLVHLGLDTVGLAGTGFTVHVQEGRTVAAGQKIVTWQPASIAARGLSPIVPVIAMEAAESALSIQAVGQRVSAGEKVLTWT